MPNSTEDSVRKKIIIVPDGNFPAMHGPGNTGEKLLCSAGCGHILIEEYDPECYPDIGIKCFNCGGITWTPPLPEGEIFCVLPAIVEGEGELHVQTTVNVPSYTMISSRSEFERIYASTAPRDAAVNLDISSEGLDKLELEYDSIVGGKLATQKRLIAKKNPTPIIEFPFAWAVDYFRNQIKAGSLDFRQDATWVALMWLYMFSIATESWRHHPRFHIVAKDLGKPKSFLHTLSLLISVICLSKLRIRINFSLENNAGEANPDLYVKTSRGKIYFEVKAPEVLQWDGQTSITTEDINKVIKNQIKQSKNQINRSHRGILILASSIVNKTLSKSVISAINHQLSLRGHDHKNLAAVIFFFPQKIVLTKGDNSIQNSIHFSLAIIKNEYYDGENPITFSQVPT